ncbi:MAG TPA: GntR family transcriptional regulator [Anaerolineae bacterium]|nr:GntR family transcriptional regulator [Anaerolineae bacterium]
MLKRAPNLTEQTRLYIKERILKQAFRNGRIPSEMELARALGVSRTTVRDALSKLENEGVIVRRQGAGTFVNPAGLQVRTRLDEVWSYEEVLRAHGYTPAVEVLCLETRPAGEEAARRLGLTPDEPVLLMEKRFLEGDTPAILTRNILPAHLLHCPPDETHVRQPIYDLLATCCHRELSYYLTELVPARADETLAMHLDISVGTPMLAFDEIGYDAQHQPLIWARSWFRDDRIRFRLIRRR